VFFEHSFYCRRYGGMASDKTCPHEPRSAALSNCRELGSGTPLPEEFTRREVWRFSNDLRGGSGRMNASGAGRDRPDCVMPEPLFGPGWPIAQYRA
jgi:hypothetical protein